MRKLNKRFGYSWCLWAMGLFLILGFFPVQSGRARSLPIRVAVSIDPQAYFVQQIGGHRVYVIVVLPPGANPATFEPKARTLVALSKADLYFRIRVPFENAWMGKFIAVNPSMKVVDTTEGIRIVRGDPHVWLSPQLVRRQARTICRALISLDPAGKKVYERHLLSFNRRIDSLKRAIRARFSGIRRKTFLVYHPCWGYFAREFGLKQVAIEREGKPPGAATMSTIIRLAQREGIHCIFVQPQFDSRSARVIAQQIQGRLVPLDPLSGDWSRNLLDVAGKIAACLGS